MLRQNFIITLLYQLFLACVFSPIWSQLSRPKHTASCGVWNWHLVGLLGVWVLYIIVIVATKHNPGHTQSYSGPHLTVYFKLCLSDWISHINALFDTDTDKTNQTNFGNWWKLWNISTTGDQENKNCVSIYLKCLACSRFPAICYDYSKCWQFVTEQPWALSP